MLVGGDVIVCWKSTKLVLSKEQAEIVGIHSDGRGPKSAGLDV